MISVENNLVAFYLGMLNNGTASLNLIISTGVSKDVFLYTYKKFINDKTFLPIEELPKEEKEILVKECIDTGLNFTNETLINSAKILHTIKFINENS